MIEVCAKLVDGPAFFVGGDIRCLVTFRNAGGELVDKKALQRRDISDTLAWASAQIVCVCSTNPSKVAPSSGKSSTSLQPAVTYANTALSPSRGEQGSVVFSTKPKILICDLTLLTGEHKQCLYQEAIPKDVVPSFRGQAVKYSYKLKIGLQRVGSVVKMLHLPLRILTWQALELPQYPEEEDLTPTNPFVTKSPQNSHLEQALQAMQMLSSRRAPNVYKVTNNRGKVVSLCLFKTSFRLGEDIVATLDFADSDITCVQYCVTLQSEEVIAEDKRPSQGPGATSSNTMVVSHTKCHEVSAGYESSHISLPIPLHVTPSFDTDLVSLQWKLHFEFVTSVKPIELDKLEGQTTDSALVQQAPKFVDIETMVWDLPIKIYPTTPTHVSKALHVQREAVITL